MSTRDDSRGRWHPVDILEDRVSIKGGYNGKVETAPAVRYAMGDTTHVFVELDKNALWFLKGVGGLKIWKGELRAVKVIQLLRDMCVEADDDTAVAEGHIAAVAGTQSESQGADESIDPMDAMDAMDEVAAAVAEVAPQKKQKTQGQPKKPTQGPPRAMVHKLEVPTRPPCTACGNDDKTAVYVYRQPKKRTNANLYLRSDCIGWLLSYAADEQACQGVEPETPEKDTRPGANCTAVADLRLEWDFGKKTWEAEFVAGPHVGKTRRMHVNDVDDKVWDQMRHTSFASKPLHDASIVGKKNAAKEWLTMWCEAITRNDSAAFDTIADSRATDSPQCGTKPHLGDDEVAANEDGHTAVAANEVCPAVAASPCDFEWYNGAPE